MNNARAEEEAISGTPAFELQEAHALYADLRADVSKYIDQRSTKVKN